MKSFLCIFFGKIDLLPSVAKVFRSIKNMLYTDAGPANQRLRKNALDACNDYISLQVCSLTHETMKIVAMYYDIVVNQPVDQPIYSFIQRLQIRQINIW
jgi:hypothetical protein